MADIPEHVRRVLIHPQIMKRNEIKRVLLGSSRQLNKIRRVRPVQKTEHDPNGRCEMLYDVDAALLTVPQYLD